MVVWGLTAYRLESLSICIQVGLLQALLFHRLYFGFHLRPYIRKSFEHAERIFNYARGSLLSKTLTLHLNKTLAFVFMTLYHSSTSVQEK